MSDAKLFHNKFEIPLTVIKTEEVFDNITNQDKPEFIDSRLIRDVYLPVHSEDGTSGRPFWYNYSREKYYDLIKRILEYKPIVVTYPPGHAEVLEKYINMGIVEFMVSEWKDEHSSLKKKYKDLKIYRSIVLNAYNENIDERFDAIIVPYKKILDLEWLKETSRKVPLIAIINQYCRVSCPNLDNHLKRELQNYDNVELKEFSCPSGRSLFVPRQVVLKIHPYISIFKIVDRLLFCFDYEKYIKYYTGREMLNEGEMGRDIISIRNFYDNTIIHKLYPHSNLVNVNCRFKCDECDRKCF